MSVVSVPLSQLPQQVPNMLAMATGGLRSYLPFKPSADAELQQTLRAPSASLLDAYMAWSGVDGARFGDSIPPHFAVSQMALAMISRLTARSPYPLLSVLNQGVHLRLNAPLPRDARLQLRGRLVDASDDGYRARIHSRLALGTEVQPDAMEIDAMAAVVLAKRPGDRTVKAERRRFSTVGHWQAAADEGVTFFKLTGDFNPIHTLPVLARRTRFRGCIMHGFGGFAQIFEAIRNAGYDIADINVRFIDSIPLPSAELRVDITDKPDAQGRYALRLVNPEERIFQVGDFLPAEAA